MCKGFATDPETFVCGGECGEGGWIDDLRPNRCNFARSVAGRRRAGAGGLME
jgi:hypothetical protein